MAQFLYGAHTVHMDRNGRPPHYLREWRKAKGKTLEAVAEAVGMTHQNLGKIERYKVPYSQPLLEALAELYNTDPGSLVMRNPTDATRLWSIWDKATPVKKKQIERLLDALDETGTDG